VLDERLAAANGRDLGGIDVAAEDGDMCSFLADAAEQGASSRHRSPSAKR
jgi:hypothetical protein